MRKGSSEKEAELRRPDSVGAVALEEPAGCTNPGRF
jgi:hypothetical protein